jgi:hypothetical protein
MSRDRDRDGEKDENGRSEASANEAAAISAAAIEDGNHNSNTEVGVENSMGNDGKTKSGKSNWHEIRTAPTSVQSDLVEAAKQENSVPENGQKAMAAGAGENSGSATDSSTIASIVDSVMADLRPRIVEEIAKKLAKK